ncbi:transcription regulator protein [Legionella quinlivanii]|uniref:methylated-DNA--[protein]-cysteine S-methyltransferase n=1 Tax=Legionella quinlivanii TaxID=45073 RepID=A0A0W0XS74_9GAMM|nr:methylated-DNA--[protein]-cysteine S-methyltransferase [Legionella quinlivanii]KTD47480.1 transcription regulator protein [Legionella quinlivanii]MCW8451835.1 methylated-DNA--[protein]-cysteine S-methyltransferase [Legionella quinlivanii]SEG39306.1 AraC family transcriptional regulator, regulatory protein of adaptative response / methylated-DNA-[protein]-cysteine methyltransferase [Legionella quinlivanii DSM 21216]STY09969.1 transcription regulator protein [Legionella quinlivanii]
MLRQQQIDYERIEKAIHYIDEHFKTQPSLEEIAQVIHLSPWHFQKMFSEWVGISPKKFMQYISLNYAKTLLKKKRPLLEIAFETGLSSGGRLHDLFVKIEGMTPGEFRNGGAELSINYSFAESPFGQVIVASTPKGVCSLAFEANEQVALSALKARFPKAAYRQMTDQFQQDALLLFQRDWKQLDEIKLHLAGTPFQLKVWESLLKIPMGSLATYGDIARDLGKPKSSRAAGGAIGSNPIAFLIPCHRVIQSSGKLGGYMWGETRKRAMIGWEAAQTDV